MSSALLSFNPSAWHVCTPEDWQSCDDGVNCYSYALNEPSYYWALPHLGYVKTRPQPYFDWFNDYFRDFSPSQYVNFMIDATVSDGLVRIDEPNNRADSYTVALFLRDDPSDFDLHWYRLDDDGLWSHKDGWRRPSNVGQSGRELRNPRDDPLDRYPRFGGFFAVPRSGLPLAKNDRFKST